MLHPSSLLFLLVITSAAYAQAAEEVDHVVRPNILWITSEDNAAHWLGCYGNRDARTPRLDALAEESAQFNHAYSNAPVCAIARSTILNGAYAVTQGTQHMRSRYKIPLTYRPYVSYLQEQGYYCTNNAKTDYNRKGNDRSIWDECSGKAHYKNRPNGSSFFSIFNLTVSHESSLFPDKVATSRKRGVIPKQTRLDVSVLSLPPYLPDLPEVRSDLAIYHDTLTALDRQVGRFLDELDSFGLADDTIVFYYGDHGGPTPRGKRYLTDTGVRVPLLIHVPEKWRHLSPFGTGEKVDELVSFVDFAPTLLSLCSVEKPPQMQGRAFLGTHRVAPSEDPVVFLYADRFDEIIGMRRGLTDGRFKYIRRFTSHLRAAPYSYYCLSMPSWVAWQDAWRGGKLLGYHNDLWETPQPVEELYDTIADPWEIDNLADSSKHADVLVDMRARLRKIMVDTRDTGLIPEAMFRPLAGKKTVHEFARSGQFDLERTLEIAFLASERKQENLPALTTALSNADPLVRYWGALGCLILGESAKSASPQLTLLLTDRNPALRITAAHALHKVGRTTQGKQALLTELDNDISDEASLMLINSLTTIGAIKEVPQDWVKRMLEDQNTGEYVKRFAKRLHEAR